MTYSVRITKDDGKITAWIDKDGNLCIEQPNHPNKLSSGTNWTTEAEAQTWADEHAAELLAAEEKTQKDFAAKIEADALDKASKEATIANAAKLDEIYAMLSALSNRE